MDWVGMMKTQTEKPAPGAPGAGREDDLLADAGNEGNFMTGNPQA
jgi:hypothetical protein